MTTDTKITKAVIEMAKRMVMPGKPINKTVIRAAYAMVRTQAIRETVLWKKQNITIEEC